MQLSSVQVKKFQELYFSRTGKKISDSEATKQGLKLIAMIEAVYKSDSINMKRITNEQAAPK